jgi:hypothetical protein
VVLADDSGGRALTVWLNGPEGHGLYRGRDDDHAFPETAEAITAADQAVVPWLKRYRVWV